MSNNHKCHGILLILSGLIGSLLILEIALRIAPVLLPKSKASPLPDYGNTIGIDIRKAPPGKGGFFKPDFKGHVRGPSSENKEWITNREGYRYRHEISDVPKPGLLRIVS